MLLVSACLAGVFCRYNGESKELDWVKSLVDHGLAVTACPEQLGGLTTPRLPAELSGGSGEDVLWGTGRVVDSAGNDVTAQFILGAHRTLALARAAGCREAVLKARSPSCGFCPEKRGVAAALLAAEGIKIRNEEEY